METSVFPVLLIQNIDITKYPISLKVIVGFIVMLFLLISSALISSAEISYFSLTPKNIDDLENEGSKQSKRILRLHKSERVLATILLANNFVNVAVVVIASYLSIALFDFSRSPLLGFLFEVVIITLMILFIAEILPKTYTSQHTLRIARMMSLPISILSKLLYPFSTLLLFFSSFIKNRFVIRRRQNLSLTDLSKALDLTSQDSDEDKKILKGIVEFGNIDVKDIMCARTNVIAIDSSEPLSRVLSVVVESEYSRMPVYEETFDNIKGILYVKDLLPHIKDNDDFVWLQLIRPAYFVPENKKINILLSDFQKNKIHMAVVVDEYGGTSGVVTMEDILEEIVGEIVDESDNDEPIYTKIDAGTYLFEGKILLNDFFKISHTPEHVFAEVEGDAETLAGLILELKGEIPQKKEKVVYKNFTFIIESVDKKRINQVKVIIHEEPDM